MKSKLRVGIVKTLLKTIAFLTLFLSIWMFIFAVRQEYVQISELPKKVFLIGWLGLIFGWSIFVFKSWRERFVQQLKQLIKFLYRHHYVVIVVMMVLATIVQLFLITTFKSRATTDLYALITGIKNSTKKYEVNDYLSINPNNRFIFFVFYFIYQTLAKGYIFLRVLQFFNLLTLVLSLPMTYLIGKRLFSKKVGMIAVTLTFLMTSFSRLVLETYTDIPVYFLSLLVILLYTLKNKFKYPLIGLLLGVMYLLKPSGLILLIAYFLLIILELIRSGLKSVISVIVPFITVIISMIFCLSVFKFFDAKQTIVKYDQSKELNLSTFLLYGSYGDNDNYLKRYGRHYPDAPYAKYGGNNTEDFQKKDIDQNLKIIWQRYSEMGFLGYLQHFFNKLKFTSRDGTFADHDCFIILTSKKCGIVKYFQTYYNGIRYPVYRLFCQMVWLIILLGVIFSCFIRKNKATYLLQLSLIGLIMFLMIFEGGTGRYLIQGWAYFLILAAFGYNYLFEKLRKSRVV